MTPRRSNRRPILWLVFAVLVAVPSVQLTRLLRATNPTGATSAMGATGATSPAEDGGGDPEPFRYEPVGGSRAPIAAAATSRSGRLVAVLDEEGEATVWDVHAGKHVATVASGQRPPASDVATRDLLAVDEFTVGMPGMSLLGIAGSDGRFHVWSLPEGRKDLSAPHSATDAQATARSDAPLVDVAISLEGGAFSVSGNGSLALWRGGQPDDSALIWITRSPGGSVHDVDISPDNQAVAVAADEAVYLLTPRTRSWTTIDTYGAETARPRGSPREVRFSPGGGLLAAAWSDGEIRVYSLGTRERVHTMRFGSEGSAPKLLAFSAGDKLLAATDGLRVIQVWPMRQFGAPVALTAPRGPVRSMWFAPDGRRLVISAYGDRYLRTLPLPATR